MVYDFTNVQTEVIRTCDQMMRHMEDKFTRVLSKFFLPERYGVGMTKISTT